MDRSHGEEYDAAVGEGFAHHSSGDRRLQCIPARLSARERWQRHSLLPNAFLFALGSLPCSFRRALRLDARFSGLQRPLASSSPSRRVRSPV
jgi:hypothetical protein